MTNHYHRRTKKGHLSGLEDRIADDLKKHKVKYKYETMKVKFMQPAKPRTYTPDFVLPNGIIIEAKGRFTVADRQKHLYVKDCCPDLDIRFVFQNPCAKIRKGSKTSYAMWCDKHKFKYAKGLVPLDWTKE